jgi:hypothetical protein
MKKAIYCLALGAALLTGCATRIGDFTVLSTKNFDVGAKYHKTGRFAGEDIGFLRASNLKTATDNAIDEGKGVYIANVVLEFVQKFVYVSGYRVTGDVYAPVGVGYQPAPGEELFELVAENGSLVFKNANTQIIVQR